MRFFQKNRALSLFYLYYPLTSPEKTEQSHDPIPRTLRYDARTHGRPLNMHVKQCEEQQRISEEQYLLVCPGKVAFPWKMEQTKLLQLQPDVGT